MILRNGSHDFGSRAALDANRCIQNPGGREHLDDFSLTSWASTLPISDSR